MTESEELFEQYCQEQNVGCNRIDEGVAKTPDYLISRSEEHTSELQ